jgi:membrane protein DedA with SNARE-associated domain
VRLAFESDTNVFYGLVCMNAIQALESHAYLTIFFGLLLEYFGLPIPADIILIFFGAFVYWGKLNLWIVLATSLTAPLLGDHFWFFAGRRGGKRWLHWYCRVTLGSAQCTSCTENFFQRYGTAALLFAKFVPGLRTFATPMAGMAGLAYSRFFVFDLIGTSLWVVAATGAGMLMAPKLTVVIEYVQRFGGLLSFLFALSVLIVLAHRLNKRLKYGEAVVSPEHPLKSETQ